MDADRETLIGLEGPEGVSPSASDEPHAFVEIGPADGPLPATRSTTGEHVLELAVPGLEAADPGGQAGADRRGEERSELGDRRPPSVRFGRIGSRQRSKRKDGK